MTMLALNHNRRSSRGFTLTELLVAVAVLVIVIIATSKIFGTASQITGLGQANQDVLAEAAAIEAQLRSDIARLSREGFFAIRNVAVRNDVNGVVLLNPSLPPNAIIRADQLVFFANGVQSTQTYRLDQFSNHKGQATASRVYFGHGFQLPRGLAVNNVTATQADAHDPNTQAAGAIAPWWTGPVTMVRTRFRTGGTTDCYQRTAAGTIDGTQPPAPQWTLARQAVALVDDDIGANDDNSKTDYLLQTQSARSIFVDHPGYGWSREVLNGRVDAAATLLNEIRRWVTFSGTTPRPWNDASFGNPGGDQRDVIQSAVYWPRAERKPPGQHRVDQALTTNVISSACSSLVIDWTYEGSDFQRVDANNNIIGGVGEILDPNGNVLLDGSGNPYSGMILASTLEQPWFGLTDVVRGVGNYGDPAYQTLIGYTPATTIAPANIESQTVNTPLIQDYWATFGYNETRPRNAAGNLDATLGYTPWPTAIRVTMVLHDPRTRLEAGREVQFIIDLPRR